MAGPGHGVVETRGYNLEISVGTMTPIVTQVESLPEPLQAAPCWPLAAVALPWLLGFAHARATHFSVAIGAVVAYLALIEPYLQYDATHLAPSAQDNVPGNVSEQSPGR
jgi:hypothetical protein